MSESTHTNRLHLGTSMHHLVPDVYVPVLMSLTLGGLMAAVLFFAKAGIGLTLLVFILTQLLGGLITLCWWRRYRRMLRSLAALQRDMLEITEASDPERRLMQADSVEATRLMTSVNTLLASMHAMQRKHAHNAEQLQLNVANRTEELSRANEALREQNHIISSLAALGDYMRGNPSLEMFSTDVLTFLIQHFDALSGSFYMYNRSSSRLERSASHALLQDRKATREFALGEGLIGQTALERFPKILNDLPVEAMRLRSASIESKRMNVMIIPIFHESNVNAVIELASIRPFGDSESSFMDRAAPLIGISLNSHLNRQELCTLLEKYQHQATAMQEQQQRLQQANEALAGHNLELEVAQQEIEEKARELAQTNQYKTDFLANMSHELRTPLNSLLILSQSLSDNRSGNLLPEQLEFISTIHNAGRDLLNLINDVLDLSRVEAGKLQVDFAAMDPVDLLAPLDRTFRKMAESKGVAFHLEVDAETPRTLLTDGFRLQQILRNLISNAIKFTAAGSVNVRIEPKTEGVLFSVVDTGIGISGEVGDMIFEAFHQADVTTARRYGGTGLGLAISRHLCDLLNGRLQFESREGEGATFTLWLPAAPGQLQATPRLGPVGELDADGVGEAVLSGRVLIVDDDMRSCYALSEHLEKLGLQTELASNGREAIEVLAKDASFELVLMDLKMPVMDGHETLRHLRSNPETASLPVIALLSLHDDPLAEIQSGFDGTLVMPLEQAALMKELHRHLESADGDNSSLLEAS